MHDELVKALSSEVLRDVIGWRRAIHENPEAPFEERATAKLAADVMKKLGLEVRTEVGGTGVVALLRGAHDGPTVAIRGDMDSLPIEEETGRPWCSKVNGRMHACGHDGHTSMIMGAACVLSRMKDQLHGNVKFIFQPSEEKDGGAEPMIRDGAMDDPHVDAVFACHLWPDVKLGGIKVHHGPAMASLDAFNVKITGKGGHVATPHKSIDAIATAGSFLVQLQTIVSREMDPTEPVVVSVGTIKGGMAYNAIAHEVEMSGTVRAVNPLIRGLIKERIESKLRGACEASGAGYEYDYHFGYPPVVNSCEMAEFVQGTAARLLGRDNSSYAERPSLVGEDFAYFAQSAPGAIYLLGVGDDKVNKYPLHHPRFDFDEEALGTGVRLHSQLAVDYLAGMATKGGK